MSFCLSFYLALLGPTGAHWLDGPPDVSCRDGTQPYAVDGPLLSCGQQLVAGWAAVGKVKLRQAQGGTPGRLQGARPWRFSVPSILPAVSTAVIRLTRILGTTSGGDGPTTRVRLRRGQAGPVIRHSLTISLGGGVR